MVSIIGYPLYRVSMDYTAHVSILWNRRLEQHIVMPYIMHVMHGIVRVRVRILAHCDICKCNARQ